MRIPRIFTEQTLVTGELMQLEESASHHLSKVLRMQAGRELILFNGTGGEFAATIQEVSKKHVAVAIGAVEDGVGDHVAQPLVHGFGLVEHAALMP